MYLWTSEAVSAGHPDKVADQIADAILDAHLAVDPFSRVACEVTLTTDPKTNLGFVLITGEITSDAKPDMDYIARSVLKNIGYDRDENSYNADNVEIVLKVKEQSREISKAVTKSDAELGAGDQGIMFGYAINECPEKPLSSNPDAARIQNSYMPLTHALSFEVLKFLEKDIKVGRRESYWLSPFLPDAKSQVTILYDENGRPVHIDSILLSTCHRSDVSLADLEYYVESKIKEKFKKVVDELDDSLLTEKTKWIINPAGAWNIGGPAADTGLSGRKIVVDNYGADCPVGGGSFSGKDPTKVDRSAAYAARHLAKNIVHLGFASSCQVQIAYAIGIAEPVSVRIKTSNSETFQLDKSFSLTPKSIIERFDLRRPIYQSTASGGHFGRSTFPWEQIDLKHCQIFGA